jgi:hypothetical protein
MKLISKAHRCGKTYELIHNHFLGRDSILLVLNNTERERIIREYELTLDDANRVITWSNCNKLLMGSKTKILIDNLDDFLFSLLGREVEVCTNNINEISPEFKEIKP